MDTDKKVRVSPYLDDELHRRLRKLAWACNTTKTELALQILDFALNDPQFINQLQDFYKVEKLDRLNPVIENGECKF